MLQAHLVTEVVAEASRDITGTPAGLQAPSQPDSNSKVHVLRGHQPCRDVPLPPRRPLLRGAALWWAACSWGKQEGRDISRHDAKGCWSGKMLSRSAVISGSIRKFKKSIL